MTIWLPRSHCSSMYGPVPTGFSNSSGPPPPVASRTSSGQMPNAEKATFDSKATSGKHSENSTVCSSIAVIDSSSPP